MQTQTCRESEWLGVVFVLAFTKQEGSVLAVLSSVGALIYL